MLLSITQHYFKKNDSAFYSKFKDIERYYATISFKDSSNSEFVSSFLLHDLDFVLKNRDYAFFEKVMDSYYPYYQELNYIDLFLEIADLKTDFKPYIDYFDKHNLHEKVLYEFHDNETPDLLSCLFLKNRKDIADYLTKCKNYPANFIDKNYNFPYPALAIRRDRLNTVKHILANYDVDARLLARQLISPTKNFSKRKELIHFFIESGFIDNTKEFHKQFLFQNKNAQFSMNDIEQYCTQFSLNIDCPEFKSLAENSFSNIRPFLHNKQCISWLIKNNIDIKKIIQENSLDVASFIILQYDNKRFAFSNYCKKNNICIHSDWLYTLLEKIIRDYPEKIPDYRFSSLCNMLHINGLNISEYHPDSFSDIPKILEMDWFLTDLKIQQIQLDKKQLSNRISITSDKKPMRERI